MESWSPFMNAQILNDETLNEIGKEVNKSAAQVIIKWNMQHNVVVILNQLHQAELKKI